MIDRFVAFLQEKEFVLSDQAIDAFSEAYPLVQDEDIADALWLAAQIGGDFDDQPLEETDDSEEAADTETSSQPLATEVIDDRTPVDDAPEPFVSVSLPDTAQADETEADEPEPKVPIQVQAAPALPDTRSIGRSLRPLMRKVPSLKRSQLDVLATVNCYAEQEIWVPILKPAPERWFDLELVVEASPFSFIWQDTIDEFQHLLEVQGAFRNVRTWLIEDTETNSPRLVVKKQRVEAGQVLPSRLPKELVDASGRRLVLFISDCRSQIWKQGNIHKWLTLWSRHGPAAVVQLLPERLWSQSELDVGFPVQVRSLTPGIPNSKLQVIDLPARTTIAPADALTLPIVTLTDGALQQWARVVAAAGRQRAPARLFDLSWVNDDERDRSTSISTPTSPEARIERFNATASPLARQLAGMMAAVPVDLSVVHLIQQEVLPEVKPVHIAEVYTSGLLTEISKDGETDTVRYDFVPGVRGLLNESTPLDQTLEVIEALSQRIARTLGFEIKSFTALLSPKSNWSKEAKAAVLPFARVATDVLYRLGGDYADLARLVERDAQRHKEWILLADDEGDETEVAFPELRTINFTKAELIDADDSDLEPENTFPPLQTDMFQIATITFEEEEEPQTSESNEFERFEFELATIVRHPQAEGDSEWVIQRQHRFAYQFIEELEDRSEPSFFAGLAKRFGRQANAKPLAIAMVSVPGDTFTMGSPDDEPEQSSWEGPQHEVTVQAFFMGKYPITQAQWRFVANLEQVNRKLDSDPSNFKGDDRPVEQVSWYDAVEFCDRLSRHTGKDYRLPTEAEWEYACRAGTTTPFHFGETISSELANYRGAETYNGGPKGEYRKETTSVNHFKVANAFGLHDMHGNVWEWCQDHWHGNYEGAPTDGSAWLTDNERASRLRRGGSWLLNPRSCRSASRIDDYPDVRYSLIGFRVVCSAPRTL